MTRLYQQQAYRGFVEITADLPATTGEVAWGDYDNDGDLDILLVGSSAIYRNDGDAGFTPSGIALPAVAFGSGAWGDFDIDGDLDLVLTSRTDDGLITRVYRYQGGNVFAEIDSPLPAVGISAAAWGDYDNDGWLDIALTGGMALRFTRIYRNDHGQRFLEITSSLAGLAESALAWGDENNDGRLDLLAAGYGESGAVALTKLYRSQVAASNVPPSAPAGLGAETHGDTTWLRWQAGADANQAAALSYNVRIGTVPGGADVVAPSSALSNGYRRVAAGGNAGMALSWPIRNLAP